MRFLTLVRRPVDSEDVVDFVFAELLSCASDLEKRPDSRLLDFFLSPNIATIGGETDEDDDEISAFGPATLKQNSVSCLRCDTD